MVGALRRNAGTCIYALRGEKLQEDDKFVLMYLMRVDYTLLTYSYHDNNDGVGLAD